MSQLLCIPRRLHFSVLPMGQLEFFCFVSWPAPDDETSPARFAWTIEDEVTGDRLSGHRALTKTEQAASHAAVAAVLPAGWGDSRLHAEIRLGQAGYTGEWPVTLFQQSRVFRLPLVGQVLVLVGHRIGETHRLAVIASQQFAWDLLPLDNNGLALLNGALTESLRAADFYGFGQPVLAPADGRVVVAVDGFPDSESVGVLPADRESYVADLRRAAGNHVVLDHGDGVFSFLAHLRHGSVAVAEGQDVLAGQTIGALGNSGYSSGPHLHLHFMDGPHLLTAAPLPVALAAEGDTFAPQPGNIIAT